MKKDQSTALTTAQSSALSTLDPSALAEAGFAETRMVRLGEGEGRVKCYVGEIIAPGAPLDLAPDDEGVVRSIPTWTANPATDAAGRAIDRAIVDTIVAPARLHAFLRSAWSAAQATNKRLIVAIAWTGLVQVPGQARVINEYRTAYRLD